VGKERTEKYRENEPERQGEKEREGSNSVAFGRAGGGRGEKQKKRGEPPAKKRPKATRRPLGHRRGKS